MSVEFLLNIVVGVVLPFVYEKLKSWLGLRDRAAMWGVAILSIVFSLVIKVGFGELSLSSFLDPEGFLAGATLVFSLATVIFRMFIKKDAPVG